LNGKVFEIITEDEYNIHNNNSLNEPEKLYEYKQYKEILEFVLKVINLFYYYNILINFNNL